MSEENREEEYHPSPGTSLREVVNGFKVLPPTAPKPTKGEVPFAMLMDGEGDDSKGELPADMVEAQETLQAGLEDLLYYWKDFPLELPPSDLPEKDGKAVISLDSLFTAPTTKDERTALAMGPRGRKSLNDEQKKELRKKGTVSIPSEAFPGKNHTWQVAAWLQRFLSFFSFPYLEPSLTLLFIQRV